MARMGGKNKSLSGVGADVRLNLEGEDGDTYFIYNSTSSKVELYVNNTKVTEWGV